MNPDPKPALDYLDGCEATLRRVRETQMQRIATAARCAEAVAYLASDAVKWVAGVVLEVSGGWSVAG